MNVNLTSPPISRIKMAVADIDVRRDFQNLEVLSEKINNLFFSRAKVDEQSLEKILDDLNSINYRYIAFTSSTV